MAWRIRRLVRAVAQLGRAPGSGPGGRGFKSHQPDSVNAVSVAVLGLSTGNPKTGVWHKRFYTVIVEGLLPMHSSVTIVGVLIGIAILFFGRKLFWLCVAAVGFAVGVGFGRWLVKEAWWWLALFLALVLGVLDLVSASWGESG